MPTITDLRTECRFIRVAIAALVAGVLALGGAARAANPRAMAQLTSATPAPACQRQSPAHTLALVELYTSEGCSSCPPADAWLRQLAAAGFGLDQVVPVALHVDYWDYIGWKDPFASPRFSARQREIAAQNRSRVVYTPQVVLAGRDHRGWGTPAFARDVAAINRQPARADLSVTLEPARQGVAATVRATATLKQLSDRGTASMFVAPYQNDLSTRVAAGENRGVTLQHDFVARDWHGPIRFDDAGRASVSAELPAGAGIHYHGVVVFVQSRQGEVLQALAVPRCDPAIDTK